jgi:hypothetical protein
MLSRGGPDSSLGAGAVGGCSSVSLSETGAVENVSDLPDLMWQWSAEQRLGVRTLGPGLSLLVALGLGGGRGGHDGGRIQDSKGGLYNYLR